MPTRSNLARRLLTLAIASAAALGVLTLAPTASFAGDVTSNPGYTDLRDPSAYIDPNGTWTILHIDTDHVTSTGFWYAIADDNSFMESWTPVPVRNMRWEFQPWGTWCDADYKIVGWNKWVGGYRCGPDVAKLTRDFPDYPQQVAACQASTGHDYEDARPTVQADGTVTWRCDDWVVDDTRLTDSNANLIQPAQNNACAPWEPQGSDGYGNKECYHQFYSWLNDPRFPNGGLAGNGGGGTGSQVTETATVAASASQTVIAKATRTVAVTVARGHRTVRVTGKVHGHQRTVTGTAPVLVTAKATSTQSARGTVGAARSASASCTRATAAAALTCAKEQAKQAAQSAATTAAHAAATAKANALAAQAAEAVAKRLAHAKALHAKVPTSAVHAATRLAHKRAQARLHA